MLTLNFMTLGNYLLYLGMDLGLLIVAGFCYVKFTPLNEIDELATGNTAAAIALAGAMIGYGLVVYSATTHAYGMLDTAIWSLVSLVMQIVAVEICRLLLYFVHDDWSRQIKNGDIAHGVFAGAFSLTVGMINAACLT